MNVTAPNTVADSSLPLLVTLIEASKQAHWQWRNCAGEHKHRWSCVIARLDERISQGEEYIEGLMDLNAFHAKRMIVE